MLKDCFLRSELFTAQDFTAIFSLRHGGISPPPFDSLNLGSGLGDTEENIAQNMDILMRTAKLSRIPHQAMQVHGTNILICRGSGYTHQQQADILIGVDGAAVAVRIADCVPILLADVDSSIVAAVHAGWRGTAAQAAIHAVKAMQQQGAKQERIMAYIGPCIGVCCFEIDAATADMLVQQSDDADQFIHDADAGIYADLAGLNVQQLQYAGVQQAHIEQMSACTYCDKSHFYSWRRDGKQAGRHLAIVAPPKDSLRTKEQASVR